MRSIARFILRRDLSKAASFAAYAIAGALAAEWVRPSMWSGWYGTGQATHFMFCVLWCGIAWLCALLDVCGSRGSGRVALRFALAGIIPVAIPVIVRLA